MSKSSSSSSCYNYAQIGAKRVGRRKKLFGFVLLCLAASFGTFFSVLGAGVGYRIGLEYITEAIRRSSGKENEVTVVGAMKGHVLFDGSEQKKQKEGEDAAGGDDTGEDDAPEDSLVDKFRRYLRREVNKRSKVTAEDQMFNFYLKDDVFH